MRDNVSVGLLLLGLVGCVTTPPPIPAVAPEQCGAVEGVGPLYAPADLTLQLRHKAMGQVHYPESLRAEGRSGRVTIRFVVDSLGKVVPSTMRVTRSSHVGFEEAAKEIVRTGLWFPAEKDGRPVAVCTVSSVNFSP